MYFYKITGWAQKLCHYINMISPITHSLPKSAIYICPDSHRLLLQMGCLHACFIPTACENLGRLESLARCGASTCPKPLHFLAQYGPELGHCADWTAAEYYAQYELDSMLCFFYLDSTALNSPKEINQPFLHLPQQGGRDCL